MLFWHTLHSLQAKLQDHISQEIAPRQSGFIEGAHFANADFANWNIVSSSLQFLNESTDRRAGVQHFDGSAELVSEFRLGIDPQDVVNSGEVARIPAQFPGKSI